MKFYIFYKERGRHRHNVYNCVHEFKNRESAERWVRGQAIRLYERVMLEGKSYYFIPDYDFFYKKRFEQYEKTGIKITDKVKALIAEKAYDDFYKKHVLAYVFATYWTDEDDEEVKE